MLEVRFDTWSNVSSSIVLRKSRFNPFFPSMYGKKRFLVRILFAIRIFEMKFSRHKFDQTRFDMKYDRLEVCFRHLLSPDRRDMISQNCVALILLTYLLNEIVPWRVSFRLKKSGQSHFPFFWTVFRDFRCEWALNDSNCLFSLIL